MFPKSSFHNTKGFLSCPQRIPFTVVNERHDIYEVELSESCHEGGTSREREKKNSHIPLSLRLFILTLQRQE